MKHSPLVLNFTYIEAGVSEVSFKDVASYAASEDYTWGLASHLGRSAESHVFVIVSHARRPSTTNTTSPTDNIIPLSITSNAEIALGATCASLVTLRPLIRRISGQHNGSSHQNYSDSGRSASSRSRSGNKSPRPFEYTETGTGTDRRSWRNKWRGKNESDDTMREDLIVGGAGTKGAVTEVELENMPEGHTIARL